MNIFLFDKKDKEVKVDKLSLVSRLEKIAARKNISAEEVLERLELDFVVKYGVDYYKGYVIDQYQCPKCHRPVGDEVIFFNYCPHCGQELANI